jgi:putative transposase
VKPETVIHWHRLGFKLFWRWKSRVSVGRPKVDPEVRDLIRRMAFENPFWGAPRIHAELVKLGFYICERSVQRWIPKRLFDPKRVQSWRNFLDNHREVLSAMDFMVVPTWNFGLLYVLVILDHGRRVIRHFNVTAHPTAKWVRQQLREAFPFDDIPKYLIFDRDTTFGAVKGFIESMGIKPKVTSYHCPWQNGACERVIGTLRRDLFHHVIVINEEHLRRLLKDYLRYYHDDRTHLALNKDSPHPREAEIRLSDDSEVIALPRCGGLHHRYTWHEAA